MWLEYIKNYTFYELFFSNVRHLCTCLFVACLNCFRNILKINKKWKPQKIAFNPRIFCLQLQCISIYLNLRKNDPISCLGPVLSSKRNEKVVNPLNFTWNQYWALLRKFERISSWRFQGYIVFQIVVLFSYKGRKAMKKNKS